MSYYQYGKDILQDVLFRGGESPDLSGASVSDYLAQTKQYVQRAYQDALTYAPWPWALKDPPGTLTLLAEKTNTITITRGNTSATLGTAITTSVAGWWIEVDEEEVPYRIIANVAGNTSVTLDAVYNEPSVTAGTCSIYKDEYSLAADCLKPWRAWDRNNQWHDIDIIQASEMAARFPARDVSSKGPMRMAVIRGNMVRIDCWPLDDNITVEYDYTMKPSADLSFDGSTADVPVVPTGDRHVIADLALVMLMIQKNDQNAQSIANVAKSKLDLMFTTYIAVGKFRRYVKRGQGLWR